ncbi:roadblock/LC7 domain-containing protein [Geobacter sp. AOG1]|uniref:roadblock/LC7 domain-containing protein n=1 Tax=Geobacter sp. AOG1 TaxID=1566346 RepID=UPI001CC55AE3|nr:roadblock/LC7 domain-containing protein [Geobacter sp. AOG1]GFE57847.1 GTPase [Geobacter sp. AOG1]
MPFKTILRELVETVPGASGAILADWEGEAVEQYCHYDDFELKVLGAHKGILLNHFKELHAGLSTGDLEEAIITTATQHVIVGTIGPDYSLVMTLNRNAILGQALYYFRQALKRLTKEIC